VQEGEGKMSDADEKMFVASAEYERFMGRWSRLLAPELVVLAGIGEEDRVLDVGTGTGSLASSVLSLAPQAHVVGIDPSAAFVAYARSNVVPGRAHFEVGDVQALRFEDATFDHTFALLVMNFVLDHDRAIAEMRRVTRPGGGSAPASGTMAKGCPRFASVRQAPTSLLCRKSAAVGSPRGCAGAFSRSATTARSCSEHARGA
jgi:ubiquinone/menaquinone biosynthesis C-methylase UbiE